MSIDPSRAPFVRQQYRYATAFDSSVLSATPLAREIQMDTYLNAAGSQALADELLARLKLQNQCFEVVTQGLHTSTDLAASPPTFDVTFDGFTSGTVGMMANQMTVDFNTFQTTYKVVKR